MSTGAPPKIVVQELSKMFTSGSARAPVQTVAVDRISCTVPEGDFLCILGPSGCGKTTLLQMMAGLDAPSAGRILVDDREVVGPDASRCYVFQRFVLFPWRTALHNVEFGLQFKPMSPAQRTQRAREMLELVGLTKFADHYPFELSGGMQQRVAIARALAIQPEVILMDEPFGALDAQTRAVMQEELMRLQGQSDLGRKTVVFVTHDIQEALLLGDRILLMTASPGQIKAEIPVNLPRPRDPYHDRFVEMARELRELLREEIARSALQRTEVR